MAGVVSKGRLTIPQVQQRIAMLRSSAFREDLSKVLGVTAISLINGEFRSSTDPYGNPWAPLKYRQGQILKKTNRMQKSFTSAPIGGGRGFRVDATASYAIFHQKGTKGGARRARYQAVTRAGRFISGPRAKGRSVRVRFLPGGRTGGTPRRQMVPEAGTGGLPASWIEAFNKDTAKLIEHTARGGR